MPLSFSDTSSACGVAPPSAPENAPAEAARSTKTAFEQLRTLARQFPRATEYAVSRELAEQFEAECAKLMRFCDAELPIAQWHAAETLRTLTGFITARRLPLRYRVATLTLVEP